jgi:hypothetical protein
MATREKNKEGFSGAGESERLSGYREALKTLERASEAVVALRERVAALDTRVNELTLEATSLLDSDGALEQESALLTTSRVVEAKLSRAREKLHQAEGSLSTQQAGLKGEFGRLFLIFKLWRVEIEKQKLSAEMVSGCPVLSIEQVCLHLKTIASLQQLEITAGDVPGLVSQAEKLLGAVAADPGFVLPCASVGSAPAVSSAAVAETEWTGPWDPGDGTIDIRAEINKLVVEEPSLTLATLHPRLRAKFPHLYKRREEVVAMNAPLPALATGIYEEQKSGGYKLYVEPLGSTRAE